MNAVLLGPEFPEDPNPVFVADRLEEIANIRWAMRWAMAVKSCSPPYAICTLPCVIARHVAA